MKYVFLSFLMIFWFIPTANVVASTSRSARALQGSTSVNMWDLVRNKNTNAPKAEELMANAEAYLSLDHPLSLRLEALAALGSNLKWFKENGTTEYAKSQTQVQNLLLNVVEHIVTRLNSSRIDPIELAILREIALNESAGLNARIIAGRFCAMLNPNDKDLFISMANVDAEASYSTKISDENLIDMASGTINLFLNSDCESALTSAKQNLDGIFHR